jgi:nitrate reductase gamma subunit
MNVLLWGVLPYVMMAILIGGLIWRYRYDQFGWTTRSSQLYESRLLRIGSPLFHFGILVVIIGHLGGLVIPKSWTEAVGISEGMYHFNALLWGTIAGVCTLIGILILIYRRRTTGPVFMATTKNDKAMYVVLVAAIVAGLATTVLAGLRRTRGGDVPRYRVTLVPVPVLLLAQDRLDGGGSPGFPGAHPDRDAAVRDLAVHPLGARLHCSVALLVPPYIVYRSRDDLPAPGAAPTHRGWAPVGTRDRSPDA